MKKFVPTVIFTIRIRGQVGIVLLGHVAEHVGDYSLSVIIFGWWASWLRPKTSWNILQIENGEIELGEGEVYLKLQRLGKRSKQPDVLVDFEALVDRRRKERT